MYDYINGFAQINDELVVRPAFLNDIADDNILTNRILF